MDILNFFLISTGISSIIIAFLAFLLIIATIVSFFYIFKIFKNIKNVMENINSISDEVRYRTEEALSAYDRIIGFINLIKKILKNKN